ncbi:MAG: M12 family metallo-peptidase [Chitinophagales bacterium]|nr:M12 family metallo-peptidase [Chitinophagales bacterium]
MKFLYRIVLLAFVLSPMALLAQNNFFTDKTESQFAGSYDMVRPIKPDRFRAVALDVNSLKQFLANVPKEFSADAASRTSVLTLPMPYGGTARFSVVESPMQEPGLAAKFPDIKTYSAQGIDDKAATAKLDWTGFGFHVQILSPVSGSIYIDPYERGNVEHYMVYYKTDLKPKNNFQEVGLDGAIDASFNTAQSATGFCFSNNIRSYRIAIACTGEYAVAVGGTTPALLHSAIVTTINRVNGVYEQEVAIRLILISNNNLIEFLNAATDPFNGNDNANTLISESQSVITSNIGSSNFDIGHTFSTGGGGLAGLGVVCKDASKARGITGSDSPTGDAYDIDYVAHEVGHQFGGNHTFNATTVNCAGNRNASTAVEPGSGVTIMGYAGICGSTNDLAPHSIPNFHSRSQQEIGTYSVNSSGNTCAVLIPTNNTAPVVNAGNDYTIPANTPFMLTGSATDVDGGVLSYSWEQIDAGTSAGNWNSGNKPFFRSFMPTLSPTRYFPKMDDILNGSQSKGEYTPTNAQVLNFRLTVRDNKNGGAGICSDESVVTTVASTGFKVTSQNNVTNWTANGSNTAVITWDVAGTNTGAINTPNVSILFSADGGLSFPYTLVASTPNNGSATITIPSIKTINGRLMVKGVNNIFFNVNASTIIVDVTCGAVGATISPSSDVIQDVGSPALNLSLTPLYSTPFSANGSITVSDPVTNLVQATAGLTCTQYSNPYYYDVYPFTASVSGSYIITRTGSSIFNIYINGFAPNNLCNNWVTSNLQGSSLSNGVSVYLVAGTPYYLVVGVYTVSGNPVVSLPHNYTFNVSGPGSLFSGSGLYSDPGASFSYKYVIVDNASNNIKAISSTANLSNASNYPVGTYTVYGLSNLTANAAAVQGFVGSSFASFTAAIANQPGTYCADLSRNSVLVVVKAALPVTFTELTAKKKNNNVLLEWGTLTEINNNHFVVERSENGKDFTTKIGQVAASGNSSVSKQYSLLDVAPVNGMNYYRVKQVDNDGKYSYSNTVAINFEKAGSIVIVYPNPAKHVLNMEYNAVSNGRIQVQIIDAKGAIILQENYATTIGKNVQSININSLTKGVYVVKSIDAAGNMSHTKFIKD